MDGGTNRATVEAVEARRGYDTDAGARVDQDLTNLKRVMESGEAVA